MKFLFACPPVDEEAIRLDVKSYVDSSGINKDTLHKIHDEMGVEYSSVYIREAISHNSANKVFLEEIEAAEAVADATFEIAVIPTMFYKQHPEIGGSGELFVNIARRMGISCEIIPVKSLGSISENAEIISSSLESRQSQKPLWILSMSKGTADLKCALLNNHKIRKSVNGILNVSGMQGGTHLTVGRKGRRMGHVLMKSWLKLRGASSSMLREMHKSHEYSVRELKLDDHIEVINVFGLPLLSHLRKPLLNSYEYLSKFGPNDGYILTEDALLPGDRNILFWGADHYLRVPEMNIRVEQVLNWITRKYAP